MGIFPQRSSYDTREEKNELLQEMKDISKPIRKFNEVMDEVREFIDNSEKEEVRKRALIEKGYCPKCGNRIFKLIGTNLCKVCGWMEYSVPSGGLRISMLLVNGHEIECDSVVFIDGDRIACIEKDHIKSIIERRHVMSVNYKWTEELLQDLRARSRKISEICSWCMTEITETADKGPLYYEEYVAFGAFQERYCFCSKLCLSLFRKQYPVRIHRNCYERDCKSCNECIKRYDISNFKRVDVIEEDL